jgi:hypothetical protein
MANEEHVTLLKQGAEVWNKWWNEKANPYADLSDAHLRGTNLRGVDLRGVNLIGADLGAADLSGADLTGAKLWAANLRMADLTGANLTRAELVGTILINTILTGADLGEAALWQTVLGDSNLSSVKGLDSCRHIGPSIIDHQTLQRSGSLPSGFLRGIGLPEKLVEYLPSLLNQSTQYFSCFISYSSKDQDFADRLHADLQNKGVR